ncbi:MAG: DnaJ domain-containing protein [Candidatus Woesearchaeota archaeon]|jgi:hypothetical protein
MAKIIVKGLEFEALTIRDSFNRRAQQYKNNIIEILRKVGSTEDDVYLDLPANAIRKAPANVSFYIQGRHLFFSHNTRDRYVENLFVVFKVIDLKIKALLEEHITLADFMAEFSEDHDVKDQRKKARALLGVGEDEEDFKVIDTAYKNLARTHHPDANGDAELFKEINLAHKLLKRELV